jgi:hypothetical protein
MTMRKDEFDARGLRSSTETEAKLRIALERLVEAVERFRPDAQWCEPELIAARDALTKDPPGHCMARSETTWQVQRRSGTASPPAWADVVPIYDIYERALSRARGLENGGGLVRIVATHGGATSSDPMVSRVVYETQSKRHHRDCQPGCCIPACINDDIRAGIAKAGA